MLSEFAATNLLAYMLTVKLFAGGERDSQATDNKLQLDLESQVLPSSVGADDADTAALLQLQGQSMYDVRKPARCT